MDTHSLMSYATWRDIDRDEGRLPEPQARRLRSLVWPLLFGVAALGASGLVQLDLEPPPRPGPAPVFPATDGLPEVLVSGQVYPANFQVVFPADWPDPDGDGLWEVVMVTGRGTPQDAPAGAAESGHIICSAGAEGPAGQPLVVTVDCRVRAPSPGPFSLDMTVGSAFFGAPDPTRTRSYPHTVRPAG